MARPIGIPLSQEHHAKLQAASIAARKGKSLSADHRQKISIGTKNGMIGVKIDNTTLRKVDCVLCNVSFTTRARRQKYCIECIPDGLWQSRFKRYGVSKKKWDEMLIDQDGHCALCANIPTVVDNDHSTGITRGLLCQGCNIGMARVDVLGWVEKAITYSLKGKINAL